MGLIPRANTAAFLDPNLLSQRLEELYAGSKAGGAQKDDAAGPPAPPSGAAAEGRGAVGAALDPRGAGVPAALDPLVQRGLAAGIPPRQAFIGAIKKRGSCFYVISAMFLTNLVIQETLKIGQKYSIVSRAWERANERSSASEAGSAEQGSE